MAVDEALLDFAAGSGRPTLRAYRFHPPAVTIGRFQSFPGGLDLSACREAGIETTRRITGGLAILHLDDFTYSVTVPIGEGGPDTGGRVFEMVAECLIAALSSLGMEAGVVRHRLATRDRSTWCAEGGFGIDLECDGLKVCGSAQKVSGNGVLQHGSMFLKTNAELLARIGKEAAAGYRFISLEKAAGRGITWDEVLTAMLEGFGRTLDATMESGSVSGDEEETAGRLHREKYSLDNWLLGRQGNDVSSEQS